MNEWHCICGWSNFPHRDTCRYCFKYKPINFEDNQTAIGPNFSAYNCAQVHSNGDNVPLPIANFQNSGLHSKLLRALFERMHHARPTPVQRHLIPIIRNKRDSIVCSQTGSGKTAAYLLPVVDQILKNDKKIHRTD